MSKHPTPIPDTSSAFQVPGEHIVAELLARVLGSSGERALLPAFSARAITHLDTCATCRAGLDILSTVAADRPDLDALLAHATPGATPSDLDLADYIAATLLGNAVGESAGALGAAGTEVARHLAICPLCSTMVEAVSTAVVSDIVPAPVSVPISAPTSLPDATVVAQEDVAPAASPWQTVGSQLHRLIAPYVVRVQQLAVSIKSALPSPQISAFPLAPAQALRGTAAPTRKRGSRPAVTPQDGGFTLDLRADPASPEPWIRVEVRLHVLHTGRLSLGLAAALVASPDDPGEPAAGMAWRLDSAGTDPASASALASDVTDGEGKGGNAFKVAGDLVLTFTVGGRQWSVPLIVERGNSADPRRRAAGSSPT